MSARGPLAVMDKAVMPLRDAGEHQRAAELTEARAAVAELVEAARKVVDEAAMDPRITDTSATWLSVVGMSAALAKFGGAP